jgi:hypothetical protein
MVYPPIAKFARRKRVNQSAQLPKVPDHGLAVIQAKARKPAI